MRLIKDVQSSNKDFKEIEFNVDTVYKRSNPRKWEEEIDGKLEWLGWIYDEEQYSYNEYMEVFNMTTEELSDQVQSTSNLSKTSMIGIMELANRVRELEERQ